MKYYLAIDIGASSGRHIVGWQEGVELKTQEVYRFPNGMKSSSHGLVWDTDEIFSHIKAGIKAAVQQFGKIQSLAIDTWGVDYVLMKDCEIVRPHYAYRNARTERTVAMVHALVPFEELYTRTGIQFASFNTIYQLYADKLSGRLDGVTDFLMLPEYFAYLLTGVKRKEYTMATTTGLVNAKMRAFDGEMISRLGFPNIFPSLFTTGTTVGALKQEISEEVGGQIEVKLCASHDTACAFEAVDCLADALILSSGTWSLLGAKIEKANTSESSRQCNFTNEGGVGYVRYLKNIMGMWLVNGIVKKHALSFPDAVELAEQSSYTQLFDVNDASLSAPEDMETAVRTLLKHDPPQTLGDVLNSVYHSLAESYRLAVEEIEQALGRSFSKLYIVGGGAKHGYLNRLTQEYTGKHVIALPIEATAIGNLQCQMTEKV